MSRRRKKRKRVAQSRRPDVGFQGQVVDFSQKPQRAVDAPDAAPKVGRPKVLDDAKQREICALVSAGDSIEGAARYVGCSPSTIRREARRDAQFDEKLREAQLAARLEPLKALRAAATTHWRACAWFLERTEPDRYASRRPDTMTRQQFEEYNTEVLAAVDEEISDREVRLRVQERLREVAGFHLP